MISIIIPVYNAEKSIEACLNSVRNQTWNGVFEIIIINDGSTDESVAVIEAYRQKHPLQNIHVIHQENGGVSKARNAGLKIAKGDYIALLDSDDEWLPEKTEKQMRYLENIDLGVDFIACRRLGQKILFPYRTKFKNLAKITFRKLLFRNEAQPSTVIFKRKVLKNTGGFDFSLRFAEDLNYWLKISLTNNMFILDEELIILDGGKRSFGVSGLSANLPEMEKGFHKTLKYLFSERHISYVEFIMCSIFYRLKYLIRLIRNEILKLKGK